MARMRAWIIEGSEYESEEDFRVAVEQELAGLENMGHRLGRGFAVTPIRRPVLIDNAEVIETVGWAFEEAVMPLVREREAEPEPETEDEPLTPEELTAGFPEPVAAS